uniref:Uncharacterized protein n=1 Tax=Alexandrium catenella TaxID=2925 RepID=A0A7S1RRM0_ALECA
METLVSTSSDDEETSDIFHGARREDSNPAVLPDSFLTHWYSCKRVGNLQPGHDGVSELVSYHSSLLVTLRVLFVRTGTILTKGVLWVEEAITLCSFFLTILCMQPMLLNSQTGDTNPLLEDLQRQTSFFVGFCQTMTHIVTFLLTFFTTLNFSRWQRLRTHGVEKMWSAAGQLAMITSTFVTSDAEVLSAIDRYSRASLMLVFMSRRKSPSLAVLVQREVLTEDEVEKLAMVGEPMFASMAIWTWLAAIVSGIKAKGMIKSEQIARYLVDAVSQGHEAAHVMVSQLTAPVPLSYVWLISIIVKIHNFVHGVLYGIIITVSAWEKGQHMTVTTQCLFVFLVTVLFHAFLILNQELADPFDGMSQDAGFPMAWLNRSIKKDSSNYLGLANSLPSWLEAAGIAEPVPKKII